MGGDGGVIASQRKFIRGAKDPDAQDEAKSVKHQQLMRSQICAQSSERLAEPIVCCELGFLFNKEAVITALIEKTLNPAFSHIRGLKDIKTVMFKPNPNYSIQKELDGDLPSPFICPITGVEFNGIQPFDVLWTSGVAIASKAIREIGIDGLQADYGPFKVEDVVRLIPADGSEEAVSQRDRLLAKRNKLKKEAKAHKRTLNSESAGAAAGSSLKEEHHNTKKQKSSGEAESSGAPPQMRSKSTVSLRPAAQTVKSASDAIAGQASSSTVFKGLFHKDGEQDKHGRDLFMSVAGLRYTIS